MKIDSIEIQSYKTSFIQPFINSNQEYNYRSGWYLKISSEGYKGIGEIATTLSPTTPLTAHHTIIKGIKN